MVSQDWLFLDRLVCLNMGSFIVFRLILYWVYFCIWGFFMDWQRGRLLRSCVLVLSTMQNYVSIMKLLCFLAKVSHTTCILFATLDTMYRYNVIWLFKVTLVLMWVFFKKKKQLCFCFKKSFIVLSFAFFCLCACP